MPRSTTPIVPATTLSAKASWVVPPGIKIEEIATGANTVCTPRSERAETTVKHGARDKAPSSHASYERKNERRQDKGREKGR